MIIPYKILTMAVVTGVPRWDLRVGKSPLN